MDQHPASAQQERVARSRRPFEERNATTASAVRGSGVPMRHSSPPLAFITKARSEI
jgi:hypothetical protein